MSFLKYVLYNFISRILGKKKSSQVDLRIIIPSKKFEHDTLINNEICMNTNKH